MFNIDAIPPSEFRATITARLKKIQRDHGFTATHMMEVMGMARHTWDATLQCRREIKAIELYRLARHIKTDVDYFYPWHE